MPVAKSPENESARLEALSNYDILDTLSEGEYDKIVKLASVICEPPIVLVLTHLTLDPEINSGWRAIIS